MKFNFPKISIPGWKLSVKSASFEERQGQLRALILAMIFSFTFFLYNFDLLKRFELVTYDIRCQVKETRKIDPRIVVIEISDDSVAKIGRWPWTRDWHATLIKILKEYGAKAVVFDVLFSEASQSDKDEALAASIRAAGNVYLAEIVETRQSGVAALRSLPAFSQAAKGEGHINLIPDVDGVMRRIPLTLNLYGEKIPQLSLSVFQKEFGDSQREIRVLRQQVAIPTQGGGFLRVPLDKKGYFILNWPGVWKNSFVHYSYVDVISSYAARQKGLKSAVELAAFRDKICYVGTSAAGLFDIRPTPLEPAYPAVGVNLTVLHNLLEKKFIRELPYAATFLILLFLTWVMSRIVQSKSFVKSALYTLATIAVYHLVAFGLFIYAGVWVPIIYAMALILLVYFIIMIFNQLSVNLEKAKLVKLATRDGLTGLYNIGHFKLLLKAEVMTLGIKQGKKLSLIMGDVDNFKSTNDTYGHVTGDAVLKEVAAAVKSQCRPLDVAARYGGEEFIVMMPDTSAEGAFEVADKIRTAINAKMFFSEKGDFQTSISIGCTAVTAQDTDLEALVARADRALYEAKHTGKNKVVIAGDSPKD